VSIDTSNTYVPRKSSLETQFFKPLSDNTDANQDLGFGTTVTAKQSTRLLRRDGSFNVKRVGYSLFRSKSIYHLLLTMPWLSFFLFLFVCFLTINLYFGTLFFISGRESLSGLKSTTESGRFLESFFFSIQTFATIGYGMIHPNTVLANIFVSFEALTGMLAYAVGTGLVFARFSRPSAKILFSDTALIAPYRKIRSFQFRIVNERNSQIVDLKCRLVMSRMEFDGAGLKRKFYDLKLERDQVMFFPLNWTIVHPIDEKSPLFGQSEEDFVRSDVEFLVLLEGMDDTHSAIVNTRSSYKASEIEWGKKFKPVLDEMPDGSISIDILRISEAEDAVLP